MPKTAMILAAGLGTRMRPITDTLPKPLVAVAGRTLIDHAIDNLVAAGVTRAVVNVHYRGAQLHEHLQTVDRIEIEISDETGKLLDSGGGIVKALPLLGAGPFAIVNADTFWLEAPGGDVSSLQAMADAWDADRMDMLLMTARLDQCTGYDGKGDFLVKADGRLLRHDRVSADPVVYPGAAIIHPRIFDGAPNEPFSLNWCFDKAIASGRLFGFAMSGHILTIGTPEAIGEAEAAMARFGANP
ncbi:nucleotidyltransferase family protein [Hoeflea sp. CAU 1731]